MIIQFVPGGQIEQLAAKVAGANLSATATIGGSSGDAGGLLPTGELEPEMVAELEKLYGFDRPVHERYLKMLWDFARFDFGNSYYQDRPVIEMIAERLPVSISLGLWTTLLTSDLTLLWFSSSSGLMSIKTSPRMNEMRPLEGKESECAQARNPSSVAAEAGMRMRLSSPSREVLGMGGTWFERCRF